MAPGIRFKETMTGSLRPTDDGDARHFSFTVEAHGTRISHLWSGAPLELSGTLTIDGVVHAAAVTGTLRVDILGQRKLVYELFWRDGADAPHRFYGTKDLHLRHPLASMTVLRGSVYRHGDPLGEATLEFDLRDLPGFVAGMRPVSSA